MVSINLIETMEQAEGPTRGDYRAGSRGTRTEQGQSLAKVKEGVVQEIPTVDPA